MALTQFLIELAQISSNRINNDDQDYDQCSPDTTPDGTPYTALYDFEAQQEGDLPFRKGDTIYVTEMNGDWWEGQTEDGAMDTLPSNHAMKKN